MARTNLAAQEPSSAGVVPAFTAANVDGHSLYNNGLTMLYVKNGGVGSINVTLQTPGTVDGLAVPDRVIAVAAGSEKIIGRMRPADYNRPATAVDPETVYVDFSGVTSVTVAAIQP